MNFSDDPLVCHTTRDVYLDTGNLTSNPDYAWEWNWTEGRWIVQNIEKISQPSVIST